MSGTAEAVTALVFDAGPAAQGAAQFDAAGQKIISTNAAVVNATTRTVDAQGTLERQLARLTRQIDPAAAAQAKLEAGQRLLERAFQRGAITADEQAERLALLDAKYNSAAAAAQRLAAANDRASASQDAYNRALGVSARTPDDTAKRAADVAAFGVELDRLKSKYDPLFAAQQRYRATLAEIAQAERVGALAATQAAAAREAEKERFAAQVVAIRNGRTEVDRLAVANDNAGASTGRFGGILGQAGYQIQDFATQVQMGGNALMAFGVQGAQLLGAFGTGGAIAGAILVGGTLLAQYLGLGAATDTLSVATDAVTVSYDRMNDAAERRVKGLEAEAEAVLRLADEYRGMGLAAARAETLLVERRGAALDLEAGRIQEALQGTLSASVLRRLNPPDGSAGSEFGLGDLGLARADEQLTKLADIFARVRSEAGQTQQNIRELATEADRLAQAGGTSAQSFVRLRDAALDMLPAAAQLDAAQRQIAVQTIAAAEAMGASDVVVARYAARFGSLAAEILAAGRSLNALRQGAIGGAEDRIANEIARNEAVLRAFRNGGREAAQAVQEAGTRQEQIIRRVTELEEARQRQMVAAGSTANEAREVVRELRTEFVAQATAAVDGAKAVTDALRPPAAGARETAGAVRDIRDAYAELRRDAQTGLLLVSDADARAVREISQQLRGTALDPAVRARAEQEATRTAEREAERRTREADRFTQNWGDRLAQETTRGFFEGSRNGETLFQRMGNSLKNILISAISAALSRNIFQPLISSVLGGGSAGGGFSLSSLFGGGTAQAATTGGGVGASDLGGLGTLRQAYNGLTSPGGLGSFFPGGAAVNTGFGGLDGLLNTSLVTPTLTSLTPTIGAAGTFLPAGVSGPVLPAALPIAEGGLSIAGSLGPLAAIGGGAYGIYSGIQKGGIGGGLGAAGGAVSTVTGLGMLGAAAGLLPALGALGPIGLGIGAALAIAGALLPGQKPSGQGQLARVQLESGERTTDGLGGDRFSPGNMDAASGAVNNIKALADEIEAKLQASGLVGGRAAGAAAVGVTNSTLYLDINGEKAQFANNEQGSKDLAAAAGRMVINSLIEGEKQNLSRIGQGGSDRLGILLGSGTPETLGQNLQWYDQVYKAFDDTGEAADKTAEAIKAVEAEFAPLIAKAQELGLSTDNIVKARAKDIESAKEAVAEAEAARLAELAGIRSTLQMRQAAANDTADHEARMLAGQVTRAQAWAEELRGLEQRLTALGSSTEDTAAQLETLTAIQSAEYWRNFATSMEALDRAVSGRILRAGGRTGAADRLDFEAAAAEQIKALAVSLADLGLTAEQAAAKIDQTQQAIQAERDARARAANDQIVALDQSVIGRILRATGRGAEADAADFEAAAALEVRNLARTLDDLGYSAEVVASKILETEQAIGLERIAMQKRIADEAASIAAAQLEQVMRAGQSIREYLNRLATDGGPGGVSREQALAAAQGQFTNDLAGARQNDQDALARITGTADRLLEAGRGMYGSTLAYQQLRAMIVTTLQGLEQTRTYDAAQGFATGGSFMATGPAGTDNLSLSNVRVTAGEMVNISRQDSMGAMASELRALRQEVAELRREQVESIRQQTRVIAAVGEETTEHGAKTVQLLSAQVGATRLAGAA